MQKSQVTSTNRRDKRQLLIENKVSFQGPESELSIYDTYRNATRVGLGADQLLYCGMVTGRKVMHSISLPEKKEQSVTFLPNESYVMSPGQFVEIDFPEASEKMPTTCLTIELPKQRIESISEKMRDLTLLDTLDHDWQYRPDILHVHHTAATQQLLEKLVSLFTQNHSDKEMMIDLGVSELIIRLLRQQGRDILLNFVDQNPDASGITMAIHTLEQNIAMPLDIELLCRQACMSRSKFFVEFKKQLGCSPSEYLQQQRLKMAAEKLRSGTTVSQACYDVGFNDLSHFSRRFSLFFDCNPSHYRSKYMAQIS